MFDHIFDQQSKTVQVYNTLCRGLLEPICSGVNSTIFAYGPTGSGKTHTMIGNDSEPGIMYLFVEDLFKLCKSKTNFDYTLNVSYVEI